MDNQDGPLAPSYLLHLPNPGDFLNSALTGKPHSILAPSDGDETPDGLPADLGIDSEFHMPDRLVPLPLELPTLEALSFGTVKTSKHLDLLSAPSWSDSCSSAPTDTDPDDLWQARLTADVHQSPLLNSWDLFADPLFCEPPSAYVGDAGPRAFDAILDGDEQGREATAVVQPQTALQCLQEAGMGRGSLLYRYDEDLCTFVPTSNAVRMSGVSRDVYEACSSQFLNWGREVRYLQAFIDRAQSDSRPRPSGIALANCAAVVLSALWTRFTTPKLPVQSIMQLQAMFHTPGLILDAVTQLISSATSAGEEAQICSRIFQAVQGLELQSVWLRDILLEMLARVSRPWLESAEVWIGLRGIAASTTSREALENNFATISGANTVEEVEGEPALVNEFDYAKLPTFIGEELGRIIFQTGSGLRLLKEHASEHPLCEEGKQPSRDQTLQWTFGWEDVERVRMKAEAYESGLQDAMNDYAIGKHRYPYEAAPMVPSQGYRFQAFGKSEEEIAAFIADSTATFSKGPRDIQEPPTDKLQTLVTESIGDASGTSLAAFEAFAPPMSLMPDLSFGPLIRAQARLVNVACLRLFFKDCRLEKHLSLLRRYHLLGDGVFSSRLAHALFDPDMGSAERRRGVVLGNAIMGLRLGSRDNWPPASSELRLALMGVLTESYLAHEARYGNGRGEDNLGRTQDLPGGLSFAVRAMSEEELENCLDPNTIQALDFLRIDYHPPAPLGAVISASSLRKYDQIFKLFLRILRMLFVVNQLFRAGTDRTSYWQGVDTVAQKFRIEAHNFVSTISAYFFDVGVAAPWGRFEEALKQIRRKIDMDGPHGKMSESESIDRLREFHERVLDRIMYATLLRKRQAQVMKLLEDIFTSILMFARYSRSRALGLMLRPGDDVGIRQLYGKFRKRVAVFVGVCRGLSDRRGYGEKKSMHPLSDDGLFGGDEMSEDGGNTIGQLLLKLEMTDYFSQPLQDHKVVSQE